MEESLTLSTEHRQAVEQGAAVPMVETATQMKCVVVSADVYQRIKQLLPDFDPRETYAAVDEVMREDWSGPKMAEYDHYESRQK